MNWQLTNDKDWTSLCAQFPWVKDMEGVPQDPLYHAEGDVAVHTQMVLDALHARREFRSLHAQDQEILWAAALMHDMEKRSTTVAEPDGRITSAGHAKKGEFSARAFLYRHGTPFAVREQVAKLVRHHGLPLWVMEKEDPLRALLRASCEVNMQHLYLLAMADVLGRTCTDQQELLYKLELFREYCREQQCWEGPKEFPGNAARFEYFYKEQNAPDYEPFDTTQCEVVMLCGLPGAGKDTWAQRHCKDLPVLSLDDLRRELKVAPTDKHGNGMVIQAAKEKARVYLRRHQSFVWNATNVTRSMREQLVTLFVTYKARIRMVYLEVPYARLLSQNRGRHYNVPEAVINKLIDKLDVPQVYESHELTLVTV